MMKGDQLLVSCLLMANVICCQSMAVETADECEVPADIAFAIDSSRSIWIYHFYDQIKFVQNLTKIFNIGPDENQVHVAALTFSDDVAIEFKFDGTDTAQEIYDKTGSIIHAEGESTYTHDALKKVRDELFSIDNGARSDVKKICILLTDGASTYPAETLNEAKLTKDAGITVIAIGIGNGVNDAELEAVVSEPSEDHYFHVENFDKLQENLKEIGIKACDAIKEATTTTTTTSTTTTNPTTTTTTTTTTPTTTPPDQADQPAEVCKGKKQDIIYIVDMSNSIWGVDFAEQLDFLYNLTGAFDIDSGSTRIGMMTFSTEPALQFFLNSFDSMEEIQSAILAVEQLGGLTNTHLALEEVIATMAQQENGFRQEVDNIVILFTDGISKFPQKTKSVSQILHKSGFDVIAIGVGRDVDVYELNYIASKPEFVFKVGGYDQLEKIKNILAKTTCEGFRDRPACEIEGMGDVAAFSAFVGADALVRTHDIVIFDKVIFNINDGYDQSTGIFTAPTAGLYRFAFSTKLYWKTSDVNALLEMKSDEEMYFPGSATKDKFTVHSEDVAVVKLDKGDEIWVRVDSPEVTDGMVLKDYTTFSGVFLHN